MVLENTEYTVFQVHSPCCSDRASDIRLAAKTIALRGDAEQAIRAINEALDPAVASRYAITGMDIMVLPHGSLKTWGEFLLYALLWQRAVQVEL
jgi:hypothetical protein